METSSDTDSPAPAVRSRRRIRLYVVAGCVVAAMVVLVRAPTRNEDDAKMAVTAAMATAITSSVSSYAWDNGNQPVPDGVTTTADTLFVMDQEKGTQVLNILVGKDRTKNPRGIRYFKIREAKDRKRGMTWTADGRKVTGMYDAWGNPYHLVLDTDRNEVVVVTIGGKTETIHGRDFLVYSAGKDLKLGTPDDFRSW